MKAIVTLACVVVACGGDSECQAPGASLACGVYLFPSYVPDPGQIQLAPVFAEPAQLLGKSVADIDAVAGQPCYDAMTINTAHERFLWRLYCGGPMCDFNCAPAIRIYFENGVVSYYRLRTSPADSASY